MAQTPKKCSACGVEGKLHRHHPDYAKPKETVLLCPKCHKKEHKRIGKAKNWDKSRQSKFGIRVMVLCQPELYESFQKSNFRKLANTDSEGIRACIKFALENIGNNLTQVDRQNQEQSEKITQTNETRQNESDV